MHARLESKRDTESVREREGDHTLVFNVFPYECSAQGNDGLVGVTCTILYTLLHDRHPYDRLRTVPAAVKGNVIPGLVHALRQRLPHRDTLGGDPIESFEPNDLPQLCLMEILEYDVQHSAGFWKPVLDAGLVAVLRSNFPLLRGVDKVTSTYLLGLFALLERLLLAVPPGEGVSWAAGVPRAIARLITAQPPVAPRHAACMLLQMGALHLQWLADCDKWGMADSLRRLKHDSDPDTAHAARLMLKALKLGIKVNSALSPMFMICVSLSKLSLGAFDGACLHSMCVVANTAGHTKTLPLTRPYPWMIRRFHVRTGCIVLCKKSNVRRTIFQGASEHANIFHNIMSGILLFVPPGLCCTISSSMCCC